MVEFKKIFCSLLANSFPPSARHRKWQWNLTHNRDKIESFEKYLFSCLLVPVNHHHVNFTLHNHILSSSNDLIWFEMAKMSKHFKIQECGAILWFFCSLFILFNIIFSMNKRSLVPLELFLHPFCSSETLNDWMSKWT